MHRFSLVPFLLLMALAMSLEAETKVETIRVAVAANFYPVMKELSESFEQLSGHKVQLVVGSSGKLASQILLGAPFDLFLSADSLRPKQLEKHGVAIENTRRTYAIGQLVVLLRPIRNTPENRSDALRVESFDVERIAMANPDLAPYGRAAKQSLESMGVEIDRKKMAYGENVSQAFHFFETGNVDVAFVAMSQIMESRIDKNLYIAVNKKYYQPIEQQMILLNANKASMELHRYIQSKGAQQLIGRSGYRRAYNDLKANAYIGIGCFDTSSYYEQTST